MGLVLSAIFLANLEFTVVMTALPTLTRGFPEATAWMPWITSVSLVAAGTTFPIAGKLADSHSPKKLFLTGIGVLTTGSLLSGLVGILLPYRFDELVAFRILQGLGGGILAPVGLKIANALYRGKTRTTTLGVAAMVGPSATILGPNVGGIMVDNFVWQSIFLLNVPFGLAIVIIAYLVIEEAEVRERSNADIVGALLLSSILIILMLSLTMYGKLHSVTLWNLAVSISVIPLIAVLHKVEKASMSPILDPRLLSNRGLSSIAFLSFLLGASMYSGLFFLSLYAQDHPAIRADPTTTGTLLSVGAFGQVAAAPLSGILVQRTGYRIMTVTGLALATLSFVFMAYLPTRLELLAVILLANRFGGTLAAIPLTAAGLEAFESSAGAISGIRQMSNVLGGAFGPVAFGALLSTSGGVPENSGFSEVFSLLGILCLVAIFVCKFLPNREREIRGKA